MSPAVYCHAHIKVYIYIYIFIYLFIYVYTQQYSTIVSNQILLFSAWLLLILEDGTCLTCYKLNGGHPVV